MMVIVVFMITIAMLTEFQMQFYLTGKLDYNFLYYIYNYTIIVIAFIVKITKFNEFQIQIMITRNRNYKLCHL